MGVAQPYLVEGSSWDVRKPQGQAGELLQLVSQPEGQGTQQLLQMKTTAGARGNWQMALTNLDNRHSLVKAKADAVAAFHDTNSPDSLHPIVERVF